MEGYLELEAGNFQQPPWLWRSVWATVCGALSTGAVTMIVSAPTARAHRQAKVSGDGRASSSEIANLARSAQRAWHLPGDQTWRILSRAHATSKLDDPFPKGGLFRPVPAPRTVGTRLPEDIIRGRGVDDGARNRLKPKPSNAIEAGVATVAQEVGIPMRDVQQRYQWLVEHFRLNVNEFEDRPHKAAAIVRGAVQPQDDIMRRIIELKAFMPYTDVSTLIARWPELLMTEIDVAQVSASLDAASACIESVPRELLEELVIFAPQLFIKGEPFSPDDCGAMGSKPAPSEESFLGDFFMQARRLLFCDTDLEALQTMLNDPKTIRLVLISTLSSPRSWWEHHVYLL